MSLDRTALVPRAVTRPPNRRVAGLLLLAAGPVLVLGLLFVLPVTGMVAEGFAVDGRFAPGAGVPEDWAEFAPQPSDPYEVDPAEIDANREQWLTDWTDVISR